MVPPQRRHWLPGAHAGFIALGSSGPASCRTCTSVIFISRHSSVRSGCEDSATRSCRRLSRNALESRVSLLPFSQTHLFPMSQRFAPALRAAFWMSGALVSFMAMAIAGRELSTELTTFQILFFRSLIGLVVVAALLQRAGWKQIRTNVFGAHVLRNVAHFGGQYGWFYGIALIPLTEVFAIEFTVPIWTALFATLVLGERMSTRRALAVGLGFAGVLVILRPGFAAISVAALAVLGGAFCYAISHIFTKRLSATQTPLTILFYMTVIQLPLGLLPALPRWVWPSAALWPWVCVVAVDGAVGALLLDARISTRRCERGHPARLSSAAADRRRRLLRLRRNASTCGCR